MTRNQILILGTFVGLAALAGFFTRSPAARNQGEESGQSKAAIGLINASPQPLPSYRLIDLNRQDLPVDELRQGRVLLVYLTTNCDPCVKEVEVISRLYRDATPGLRVYGVSIERPAQIAAFVNEYNLQFPILIDADSRLAKSLDIHYFPSKYLIEDGMIVKMWRGKTQDEVVLRQQLGME